MEQRNNAKHSVKGDVTAIDIRPQKGLVFVVMHGYFCLSGAVIDGRRGGGHKQVEERMSLSGGFVAGRSFITLCLPLVCP